MSSSSSYYHRSNLILPNDLFLSLRYLYIIFINQQETLSQQYFIKHSRLSINVFSLVSVGQVIATYQLIYYSSCETLISLKHRRKIILSSLLILIFWPQKLHVPGQDIATTMTGEIDTSRVSLWGIVRTWSWSSFLSHQLAAFVHLQCKSYLLKGASDKYNIYPFISTSTENFKTNTKISSWFGRCVFVLCGILWTASSSECPIGHCIVYLLKSLWKIENAKNNHIFFKSKSI